MADKIDEKYFDSRVIHHRLRRGVVSREQFDSYMKELPDSAGEAAPTNTRFATPFADRLNG